MAQTMRPISTITDGGNYTGASAHGSVDGTAPDTGDYWNGNDSQTDVLEVLLTDLSATPPDDGTCTVSIYETVSDTDVAPAAAGSSVTYDIEVYDGATLIGLIYELDSPLMVQGALLVEDEGLQPLTLILLHQIILPPPFQHRGQRVQIAYYEKERSRTRCRRSDDYSL